jgi:glycosyltransferase involved in cell wall biosynthesis
MTIPKVKSIRKNNVRGFVSGIKRFMSPEDITAFASAALNLDVNRGLSGENIITLSTQDWNDLWTRKQRFMLQFARQGNKVLYVETQFHWISYIRLLKRHWRRIYLFLLGPREIEPNLFIYTPPLLLPAFQIYPVLAAINNFILGIFLNMVMRKIGMKRPLLWMYSHFNQPLIGRLNAKRALYECVDEYSGAKGLIKAEVVKKQEAATLRSVDVAVVTASKLKASKTIFNRNIHVVPNASNVEFFNRAVSDNLSEPDDLKDIPRPRLVFIGATAYWIDLDLLFHLAVMRPEWHLVMVGPVGVDIGKLQALSNIHFLGRKPYIILPNYLAWCNVALNPYKIDDVAENCSPLKLYEYMAAGLPTVSTDMPEARKFPELIRVASTYDEFISHVDKILEWNGHWRKIYSARSCEEAQNHTWEKRFLEVEKIAQETLR